MTQSIPAHEFVFYPLCATGEDYFPPFSAALYSRYRYGSLTTTQTFAMGACPASQLVAGQWTAIWR